MGSLWETYVERFIVCPCDEKALIETYHLLNLDADELLKDLQQSDGGIRTIHLESLEFWEREKNKEKHSWLRAWIDLSLQPVSNPNLYMLRFEEYLVETEARQHNRIDAQQRLHHRVEQWKRNNPQYWVIDQKNRNYSRPYNGKMLHCFLRTIIFHPRTSTQP